jgi:NADH dehydrogenase [ubiquinone] 1 alpha subcomplex assembly factor 7
VTVGDTVERALHARIAAHGHVTVAEFMETALSGYYADRDPLGARGDFTTAPEVSQMFGELIGLWSVDLWSRMGKPDSFLLAELGPGRGTLMADALRGARGAPGFLKAASLHLVEINAALITAQKAALHGFQPQWHRNFDSVPPGPMILIANEFWDALPVHQFEMTPEGWRERVIAPDGDGFKFSTAAPGAELSLLRPAHRAAKPGDIAEVCPAGMRLASAIGRRLARTSGAALIIDYGPAESGIGDSLQALKRHRRHNPLQRPGTADLTAHVDFAALAEAARDAGATAYGPQTQGAFLTALGIDLRAETLKAKRDAETRAEIDAARERLIGAKGMGSLFKVLALASPDAARPAGL